MNPPAAISPPKYAGLVLLAALLLAATAPLWIFDLFSGGGETRSVGVDTAIPGYDWRDDPLTDGVRRQYRDSEIRNGRVQTPGGRALSAFFAKWLTGKGADLVYGPHTPDVCFTATGAVPLPNPLSRQSLRIGDRDIPFGRRLYRIENTETLVYFVHLLGGSTTLEVGDRIWTRFLLSLRLRTDRRKEQCYILVSTPVQPSLQSADAEIQAFLTRWLRISADPVPKPAP